MQEPIIAAVVQLKNRLGLHARAAGKLVATASAYDAEILIKKDNKQVNAKSIMGILMLAAGCGSELLIEAQGTDANAAVDAIQTLINDRFGEPD